MRIGGRLRGREFERPPEKTCGGGDIEGLSWQACEGNCPPSKGVVEEKKRKKRNAKKSVGVRSGRRYFGLMEKGDKSLVAPRTIVNGVRQIERGIKSSPFNFAVVSVEEE